MWVGATFNFGRNRRSASLRVSLTILSKGNNHKVRQNGGQEMAGNGRRSVKNTKYAGKSSVKIAEAEPKSLTTATTLQRRY
jgi:hypothetical protein